MGRERGQRKAERGVPAETRGKREGSRGFRYFLACDASSSSAWRGQAASNLQVGTYILVVGTVSLGDEDLMELGRELPKA